MSTQLSQLQPFTGTKVTATTHHHLRKYQWRILQWGLLLADAFLLLLAFRVAYWVRFELELALSEEVMPSMGFYFLVSACSALLSLVLFAVAGLYKSEHLLGGTSEYSKVLNCCTLATLIIIVATFLAPTFIIARGWVVTGWVLTFLLVSAGRFTARRLVYRLRSKGWFLVRTVVVGTNAEARALISELGSSPSSGVLLLGQVRESADDAHTTSASEVPILGHLEELEELINEHQVEDVIVAITAVERIQLLSLCELINPMPKVRLRLSSGLFEILTTKVHVQTLGCVPLISLEKIRLSSLEGSVKNVFDYGLTVVGLLLMAPLMLLIGLLVKVDSCGPVFHRRRVLGVNGRQFDAFKFRTMHVNGDEILARHPEREAELSQSKKLKDDPRVTRLGRWLRKTSLDELPQFFNVLLGQMSLVGPRMIAPDEGEKYGRLKLGLLTVKPGITGLWQVSGRSDLSYEERVRLDIHYIRYYSIWRDLQILFIQTLPAILKGHGAY